MTSRLRQSEAAAMLTPVLTLKGHARLGRSISYFPDGKRMISGSQDGTARRWDLEVGKEIGEARKVCEKNVSAVAVSRDGRWVVMGGRYGELRVCEVKTGIVRIFAGHLGEINCIDISADSRLLGSGAKDETVLIWSLDTGKIVAGPFQINARVTGVRFSQDSKKIAVNSNSCYLDIWDVQTQKSDVRLWKNSLSMHRYPAAVFWTNKDKSIVAAFDFRDSSYPNIYEFDSSTLATVGTPFKGHANNTIECLALSFDCALLASCSDDNTIKLWAFASRQLLASFHVQGPHYLIFSPNSHQLAYTAWYHTDIYVCNTPPEILASIQPAQQEPFPQDLLSAHRGSALDLPSIKIWPAISLPPLPRCYSPEIGSRLPHSYPHPHELLPFSSHSTDTVLPFRSHESGDPDSDAMLQNLTGYINKDGEYPVARGGFGEIWKCTYSIDRRSIKVAVKALQVYADDQLGPSKTKKIKRITRELRICANLKHKNILPVYGYTNGFGPFIALVSPWAENGNLSAYLERVGADLTLVRRFEILRDIIAGLQYLHANHVIHGDFNGPNVLIHGNGTACVADFGLSLMYSEVISASQASWTSTLKGNARWMAPELLEDREDELQVRPSEHSDMYSFGGIMLQVLTNKIPYYHLSNDAAIVLCIAKSKTPSRSRYPVISETYWEFIEKCWSTDPQDRPSTEAADGVIRNEYYALSRSP